MKGQAEGIVYASKPLCYEGQLIENFYMKFEGGKVVDAKAEVGDELLQKLLNMDEGARYLGECALVPSTAPSTRPACSSTTPSSTRTPAATWPWHGLCGHHRGLPQ